MLDKTNHEITLRRILRALYQHPELQTLLAFKGGTCLYFFHNLNRFSTDLDFDLLGQEINAPEITHILSNHIEITDKQDKRYTLFWRGRFAKGAQQVKIEINKRVYPNHYEIQDFYGLSVKTMSKDTLFAHKLCAICDRSQLQNRDIYDAHFMFQNNFPIQEEIISIRTGKTLAEYLEHLEGFLRKKFSPRGVLDGLGEVLNEKQKAWVKAHLLEELFFEIAIKKKLYK